MPLATAMASWVCWVPAICFAIGASYGQYLAKRKADQRYRHERARRIRYAVRRRAPSLDYTEDCHGLSHAAISDATRDSSCV